MSLFFGLLVFYRFALFCCYVPFAMFASDSVSFGLTTTMASDASALVDGKVNVITGQPCVYSEDIVIQGEEPIRIARFLSSEHGWTIGPSMVSIEDTGKDYRIEIRDDRGFSLVYKKNGQVTRGFEKYLCFVPSNVNAPIVNTHQGKISSRTNVQNNTALLDKEKKKYLIVTEADGTVRKYKRIHHDANRYLLQDAHLPNGNWLLYEHEEVEHKGQRICNLMTIRSMNPARTKEFARATFGYEDKRGQKHHFWIDGSDGQRVEYFFKVDAKTGQEVLHKVTLPNGPDVDLGYINFQVGIEDGSRQPPYSHHERFHAMMLPGLHKQSLDFYRHKDEIVAGQTFRLQDDRYFVSTPGGKESIQWDPDFRKNRVKTISAVLGHDPSPQATHSFVYGVSKSGMWSNGNVTVYDIQGKRTDYALAGQCLGGISYFDDAGTKVLSEQFAWGNGLPFSRLTEKTLLDSKEALISRVSYTYNERGDVVEERLTERDGEALVKQYRYSGGTPSLLLEETHNSGLKVAYEYLAGTDLHTRVCTYDRDQLVSVKTWVYNEDHVLVREVLDDGVAHLIREIDPVTEAPYIGMPRVIREKCVDGGEERLLKATVLHYGVGARVERQDIYDAHGVFCYSLRMQYDAKGRLISETNALGQEEISRYDACGRLAYRKDFSGRTEVENRYDLGGCLYEKEEKGFDGRRRVTKYLYDNRQRLVGEIDPYGVKTSYVNNSFGRRTETHLPNGGVRKTVYDAAGNAVATVDAEGNATHTTYNVYRKPTSITHPDGGKEVFTYTVDGRLNSQIDAQGVATLYETDALGRVKRKIVASESEERFEYQGSYLTAKVDAEGNRTTYRYDGAGRKVYEECNGESVVFAYDSLGRLRTEQTGDLVTVREYDFLDRIIEERQESASGEALTCKTFVYDSAGNPSVVVTGGEREEFVYDSSNRCIRQKDALGNVTTTTYEESQGLSKTVTDPLGLTTVSTHDTMGLLAMTEVKKGATLLSREENAYDLEGRILRRCNTGQSPHRQFYTAWRYDPCGRVVELNEEAKTTRYAYNKRGDKICTTKPNGVAIGFTYNDLGQCIAIDASDGSVHHRMRYNRLGALIDGGDFTRTVDAKGRILTESGRGIEVQNGYDERGRRTTIRIPQADCEIQTTYTASGRVRTARKNLQGEELYAHAYTERDANLRVLEEQLINGATLRYTRDAMGRKTWLHTPWMYESAVFDAVGNMTALQRRGDERLFTYDDLYQLTSESGNAHNHSYVHDALYHRLWKDGDIYTTNGLHQIVSHCDYDANGNIVRWKDATYRYDALDRLIRLEQPGVTQTFRYDALHRCIEKTIASETSCKTLVFLYDGQNEIGAFDETLRPIELRILAEAPHAEIGAAIAIELNGAIYAPIHDLQGNVAHLVPLQGNEPGSYLYSAFGEEQTQGPQSPWRFSSKRSDEITGLIFFGRRFYIPELGCFLTPDPAGFTDSMNLYQYVHNNPMTHFDEYGLFHRAWNHLGAWDRAFRDEPFWSNPRFHGGMQAFGGMVEMSAGAALAPIPLFAPLGAAIFLHGMDHATAGAGAAFSGNPQTTVTTQLLQKAGMSKATASFMDNTVSTVATMGGIWKAGVVKKDIGLPSLQKSLKTHSSPSSNMGWVLPEKGGGALIKGRWYTEHALERMAPDTFQVMAILNKRFLKRAEVAMQTCTPEEFQRWCSKNFPNPRGIPPSVIEAEIIHPGSTCIEVITNEQGHVITVIPNKLNK